MAKATKEPVQHELTLMDSFITQDRNEYSEGDKMSALFHEVIVVLPVVQFQQSRCQMKDMDIIFD